MLTFTTPSTEKENEREVDETPVGVDVSAKVENDTIYFESFPIKDIVLSVVGNEEMANKIVEAVGDVNYKMVTLPR